MVSRVCEPARPRSSYRWHEMARLLQTEIRRAARTSLVVLASGRVAVTDVPFELVGVKLAPPSIRPGTVAKVDVIARLRSADARLATVVAPAGYGKTTLLARWAESDPRAFAWVSLDGRDDDDPRVFLRYIAAALFGVGAVSAEVLGVLSGPAAFAWTTSVPAVGAAMGRFEQPIVLVLDDLHLVDNRSCLDVLAELVRYVPGGLADRGHEPRGAGTAACPLAVAGVGAGDRCVGPPTGRAGGAVAAGGGRRRARPDPGLRADRADGGLAVGPVPRCAVSASRSAAVGVRRGPVRQRPVRVRVLPPRAPVAAAAGRGAVPHVHIGAGSHVLAVCATPCSRRRGLRRCSRGSRARTASSCRSTGRASGIATTTCSASSSATSSSGASRTWCSSSTGARWPGASPTTSPRTAVHYGQAAGETDTVAGLVDALSPPLYYDGRLETAGGVARVVRRRPARGVPRARRLWRLVACADGACRGGRALARPRRRRSLEDPALGRERHDRAVGRHAARAHDAERRRAGARGRRCGTGSAAAGQLLGSYRAPRPRSRACPAW